MQSFSQITVIILKYCKKARRPMSVEQIELKYLFYIYGNNNI